MAIIWANEGLVLLTYIQPMLTQIYVTAWRL